MFGLKNKKKKTYVIIHYEQGRKVQEYLIGEIPIKEEVVIQKSIQFFDDPEPCYIHRGAVVVRLNEEILSQLEKCQEGSHIVASYIEKEILSYINLQEIEALQFIKK